MIDQVDLMERMSLLGVKPLSARRGVGKVVVAMGRGGRGLADVVAIQGLGDVQKAGGCERAAAVVQIASRWWGGSAGEAARKAAVVCQDDSLRWWLSTSQQTANSEAGVALQWEWAVAKWPGAKEGSAEAVRWLLGQASAIAIGRVTRR